MVYYIDEVIDVSIILPRYNENYFIIDRTIKRIRKIQEKLMVQIIIVNDSDKNGYHDEEIKRIKKDYPDVLVISNGGNYGKGYSIRRGVDLARGIYVFYTDIDFPISEDDFFATYQKIQTSNIDFIIGERYSKNRARANSYRIISGKFFLKIYNFLFNSKISDSQCPFKMLKSDLAKEIFSKQKIKGYAFDAEVIYIANRLSKSLYQFPVIWEDTRENWNLVKTFMNYSVMFFDLLSIRIYWFFNSSKLTQG
ncbi:glycosyltransferase [Photorhabdus stackebrandtii]|uniref:Glycosyltransferase 2-like domain-containing protein n=1 Tax=Photorhabdus stackebrandtii TaxID=1123042 RepID=A0A7X5QMZ3_9GAMM|nr:glycosyltransferase [Photorhabdus stackebrandtii]NHB97361.1 hypothetical protein [Photorhabdus stackebrandtii]